MTELLLEAGLMILGIGFQYPWVFPIPSGFDRLIPFELCVPTPNFEMNSAAILVC